MDMKSGVSGPVGRWTIGNVPGLRVHHRNIVRERAVIPCNEGLNDWPEIADRRGAA